MASESKENESADIWDSPTKSKSAHHRIDREQLNFEDPPSEFKTATAATGFLRTTQLLTKNLYQHGLKHYLCSGSYPQIELTIAPQLDPTQSKIATKFKNNRYHKLYKITGRLKAPSGKTDVGNLTRSKLLCVCSLKKSSK